MYSKVQADFWVPYLEKYLEEARLNWADLAKERADFAAKVKNVQKLEPEVDELKQNISKLRNVHRAKLEGLCVAH